MWLFNNNNEPSCGHGEQPHEDSDYWYLSLDMEYGEPYWCEHEATYVKLQAYTRLWICKTCGELKGYHSAREVGGPDGIRRKQDIEEGVVERPQPRTGQSKGDVDWFENREELYTEKRIDEYVKTLLEYGVEREE